MKIKLLGMYKLEIKVNVDPLGFQDHINVCKSNIESNPNENWIVSGDTLLHDSIFHNSLVSPTSTFNNVQFVVSRGNQEWVKFISHV